VAAMHERRRSPSAVIPFSPHLPRALVGTQTEKCGVPQTTLRRPLHEPHLRHQLRPHPLHLLHLVSGHAAAPAGRLRVRQVGEGALIDVAGLQRPEDLSTQMRNEPGRQQCV